MSAPQGHQPLLQQHCIRATLQFPTALPCLATALPSQVPLPREVVDAQGWGCPASAWLPCFWLGRWDRPWLPGPAITPLGSPRHLASGRCYQLQCPGAVANVIVSKGLSARWMVFFSFKPTSRTHPLGKRRISNSQPVISLVQYLKKINKASVIENYHTRRGRRRTLFATHSRGVQPSLEFLI